MFDEDREDLDPNVQVAMTSKPVAGGIELTMQVSPPNPDDIVDAIAQRYMKDYSNNEKMRAAVAIRFGELVKEAVDRAALAAIDHAMTNAVQPTDGFGNPVGAPVTFSGLIAKQVAEWQSQLVDSEGKPAKKDSYIRAMSRAQWLVSQAGASAFAAASKTAVAELQREAKILMDEALKIAILNALGQLAKKS